MICDHRNVQTDVRNQGPGRESCVGFAVCAAQEWHDGAGEVLSPENVLWAAHRTAGDPTVEPTSVQFACEGLTIHQQTLETAWPYGGPAYPADRPAAAADTANQRALPPWERIHPPAADHIGSALAGGRPVVVTFRFVPRAWFVPDGIVDAPAGAMIVGGHAVLAVGVNSDDHVIIKNSWGPWWGDDGYGYISPRYLAGYGVVAHAIGAAA